MNKSEWIAAVRIPDNLTKLLARCIQSAERIDDMRIRFEASERLWMIDFVMVDFILDTTDLPDRTSMHFDYVGIHGGKIRSANALHMTLGYKEE